MAYIASTLLDQQHPLHVTLDDYDVIGVDEDPMMRTAPLGMVSGAVVGVLTAPDRGTDCIWQWTWDRADCLPTEHGKRSKFCGARQEEPTSRLLGASKF
jgi:hypothetical protein